MRPALRQQRYGEALMAAAETLGSTIAKAKDVSLDTSLPRRIRPSTSDSIPWPLVIGGILLLVWMCARGGHAVMADARGRRIPAGNDPRQYDEPDGGGGRGSGGFGGYDSGDSFGGFGGGDFGGGGASSDW